MDALTWQLVKNNHAYLVKRGHTKKSGLAVFSSEPGNLKNKHKSAHSGFNAKTIDIIVEEDDDENTVVQLTTKVLRDLLSY